MYINKIKRLIDLILSFLAMILLSWLFLITIATIKLTSKGPAFFFQKRIGKDKKEFNIIKFRTMKIDTPKNTPTHLLESPEKYITSVGKLLRKTSLDELPQLINIIKGDMSIVGPRPALWNQYDLIAERDKYGANNVRPGLTGWAQVNGRDEIPIEIKAKLDGDYIKRMGFIFDIKCMFKTVSCVIKREGVKEGLQEGIRYEEGSGDWCQ
ncbi:UDP-phosphate galactose phosphotransferase [Anaerocolumna cellulosilytica]|uniref:UDP-phosphate galactose phosphotransferase n=1 Tax=Anaerocolumna cellulosilytica TaxID=433286 RepID=A0A6S6R1F8_9FIRM|nr:sugar transferase [Anaerocolumna cellulosilytica]MBB5194427.1 O-antigen biosynthesis protein WbqP [Anaerocolumna cellulosilytica]BCJ93372.1 UDP-phosphate galactose phosphotransferase [Anaerocolumna cellulosilytica]